MTKNIIPLRPDNFVSPLNQHEQSCLTWYVLSGCSKKEAFVTFARPDMLDSKAKAAIDNYVKQFFAQKEVKEYIEAYYTTLNKVLHPDVGQSEEEILSMEERRARAKAKAMSFAFNLAENIDQASDPEFVMKMLDKARVFDGDDDVEEQPRRYLPEDCGSCAYRMFCEQNTEDMCQYCKYHQFGEDNGVHYKKTEILNIGTKLA